MRQGRLSKLFALPLSAAVRRSLAFFPSTVCFIMHRDPEVWPFLCLMHIYPFISVYYCSWAVRVPQGRVLALSSRNGHISHQSNTQDHRITPTAPFNGIPTTRPGIPPPPWASISMRRRTDNHPHQITPKHIVRYALLPFPSSLRALAITSPPPFQP